MAELDKNRKIQIEEKASLIRKKYNLKGPFDLIKFLKNYQNFEICLRYIDDDTTGLIFANDEEKIPNFNSNYVIIINRNLINDEFFERKKRFICAHEYGHFVLHKEGSSKFARRDTKNKDSKEELEAEYFARCFLMPEDVLRHLFEDAEAKKVMDLIKFGKKLSYPDIVSELFNVTPNKAQVRLEELGLVNG